MTYSLVRPSSLPYDGSAYSSLFGVSSTRPATAGTGGTSLADDTDPTSVTLASSQDAVGYQATIVAVDFAAQPGLVNTSYGTMFRLKRLADEPDTVIYADDSWALFAGDGTFIRSSRMSDVAGRISSVSSSAPTTYTTGDDSYNLGSRLSDLQAATFTLAMCVRAGAADGSSSPTDLYTIYECGLLLDIDLQPSAYRRPALRQLQRGGRGGIGGIPRAVGDRTIQGSLRRGSGSVR